MWPRLLSDPNFGAYVLFGVIVAILIALVARPRDYSWQLRLPGIRPRMIVKWKIAYAWRSVAYVLAFYPVIELVWHESRFAVLAIVIPYLALRLWLYYLLLPSAVKKYASRYGP